MMMKKYASLLFALVLALSLSVSAAADSSGVYVYDDAALLTQEEYDTLNEAAAAVSEQYGCGVYVVTVDDMADYIDPDAVTETGETGMAAFTEYAWDALGLAASHDSNGIMLALSMAERDPDARPRRHRQRRLHRLRQVHHAGRVPRQFP